MQSSLSILFSNSYTRHSAEKDDMLIVLNWINSEYDLIYLNPAIELDTSLIVFNKLLIIYSSGLDSNDLDGYSQRAICKMFYDTNLRNRINKEPAYMFLQNYLDNLWEDIKHSFIAEPIKCQLHMPRKKRL